jgi:hypothetical protein
VPFNSKKVIFYKSKGYGKDDNGWRGWKAVTRVPAQNFASVDEKMGGRTEFSIEKYGYLRRSLIFRRLSFRRLHRQQRRVGRPFVTEANPGNRVVAGCERRHQTRPIAVSTQGIVATPLFCFFFVIIVFANTFVASVRSSRDCVLFLYHAETLNPFFSFETLI